MSSVAFSQAKDAELAWIDGEIHFSSNTSKSILGQEARDNEETSDGVPVLDVLPQTLVTYIINLLPAWDSNAISADKRPFKCVRKSTTVNRF